MRSRRSPLAAWPPTAATGSPRRSSPPSLADSTSVLSDLGAALAITEFVGLASPHARPAHQIGFPARLDGRRVDRCDRRDLDRRSERQPGDVRRGLVVLAASKICYDVSFGELDRRPRSVRTRSRIVGLTETSWALGLLLGVTAMGVVASITNWRWGFIAGAGCHRRPRRRRARVGGGRHGAADHGTTGTEVVADHGGDPDPADPDTPARTSPITRRALAAQLATRPIRALHTLDAGRGWSSRHRPADWMRRALDAGRRIWADGCQPDDVRDVRCMVRGRFRVLPVRSQRHVRPRCPRARRVESVRTAHRSLGQGTERDVRRRDDDPGRSGLARARRLARARTGAARGVLRQGSSSPSSRRLLSPARSCRDSPAHGLGR